MVYSPAGRLLGALDMLQTRGVVSATELAGRLGVEARSVRRYITMLGDLGIPVEATRGRYGGYRLRPGYKLPPLMFADDEALAVTLGLLAAQRLGIGAALNGLHTAAAEPTAIPAVERALAKIERVLPAPLREQAQQARRVITLDVSRRTASVGGAWYGLTEDDAVAAGMWLLPLCTAAGQQRRLTLTYAPHDGTETERAFDCYGVVYHEGRWYAVGYCQLRQAMRIFRLDRMRCVRLGEERFARPADFDCLAYAVQSFAGIPGAWLIEALLDIPLERARALTPPDFATLEETAAGVLLRAYDDDLGHAARFLLGLRCRFLVQSPVELLAALESLAQETLRIAVASAAASRARTMPSEGETHDRQPPPA
ncbi:MAG: YafY family protein [Ktedonobacterales bacterium]